MNPITRIEHYLAAINGDESKASSLIPVTRIEHYLDDILNNRQSTLEPVTRIEQFLYSISGRDIALPNPITRIERYLSEIAGEDTESPAPITRIEYLLSKWAETGSGVEKTIAGMLLHLTDALAKPAKKLVIGMNPVQDLHGYENPWPAGGGKNLFDKEALSQASAYTNYYNSYKYSNVYLLKPNTTYIISPTSTDNLGVSDYYVLYINANESDPEVIEGGGQTFKYPVTAGNPQSVSFTTGATGAIRFGVIAVSSTTSIKESALEAFMTIDYQLEEGSTPTAWTPYENICPISGYTEANVVGAGKSITPFVVDSFTAPQYINGYGSFHNGFKLIDKTKEYVYSAYIDNTNGSDKSNVAVWFRNADNTAFVDGVNKSGNRINAGARGISSVAIDPSQLPNTGYLYCGMSLAKDGTISQMMLEVGDTATEFEAFNGTTYEIEFPTEAGTVYGGTLDVTSGVLTVDRANIVLNGTESWDKPDNCFRTKNYYSEIAYPEAISSDYIVGRSYSAVNGNNRRIGISASGSGLRVHDESFSAAADFKNYLTSHNIQLIYKLATPIEYTLTAQQVLTLLKGENNIWSDANGELELTYIAKAE